MRLPKEERGKLVFIALLSETIGVTFLSLNKKVTKEVSIGEALTAVSSRARADL